MNAGRFVWCGVVTALLAGATHAQPQEKHPVSDKILAMYIHQHWSYNHPYAARTWTLEDWRGYLDGIKRLGYNTVLIWPVLETMPDPLTPSDEANLEKIAAVIAMAHEDFAMRAFIVLCPNVAPKSEEGRKYTFEQRPFFHTDDRVDPGDPIAFGKLMAWREQLFRPLAQADGLFIIDSDPGGWPNSTNMEFVYLLGAHRRMLDRLRPGIALYYWAAIGWESYAHFYATAELRIGEPEDLRDAIALLARQHYEPWGVASARGPELADPLGLGDRVLAFNYGAIEGEPSFPLTIYGTENAYHGGKNGGQRGVMGNAQTHCVQLPNTFAFARGAQGLPAEKADYIAFANDLLPGKGSMIVEGWDALQGEDAARMYAAAEALAALTTADLAPGPLKGLLFGSPTRFVDDLVVQLKTRATLAEFCAAVNAEPRDSATVKRTLAAFVEAVETWQKKHGYSNHWWWPTMNEALRALESKPVTQTLDTLSWTSDEGDTPFDKVKNGMARLETYTPRLIAAMKRAVDEMGG